MIHYTFPALWQNTIFLRTAMKKIISLCFVLMLFMKAYAQNVTVNPTGIIPVPSGSYQRLTYDELMALPSPQEGDIAYDLTYKCMRVFSEGKWVSTISNPLNSPPNFIPILTPGGTYNDYGNSLAIDDSSNFYITGVFEGISFFGSTQLTSNTNLGDMYVAKYNKNRVLQWVQAGGSTPYGATGNNVVVDSRGNVYVRGTFGGDAQFGTITVTSNLTGGASYLAKYNKSGTIQWVKATNDIFFSSIVLDENDNLYAAGWYKGTKTFGGTTITAASSDIFLAKYDTMGDNWVSVKSIGSTGNDAGSAIALDGNDEIYVTGTFSGTVAFGSITKTASAASNSFIGKFNPITDDWEWVQTFYPAIGYTITTDNNENLYLTGSFTGSITFGTITKSGIPGGTDIFIAKLNTNGSVQWVQTAGGSDNDGGSALTVDAHANIYVSGFYAGTAKFGEKTVSTEGYQDLFIAKYNSIGSLMWVQIIDGEYATAGGCKSILTAPDGYVYAAGYFSTSASFGKTKLRSPYGWGYDIFVVKLD